MNRRRLALFALALGVGAGLAACVDGSVHELRSDEGMVRMDERVLLNKAAMSKSGRHLGEVTPAFFGT